MKFDEFCSVFLISSDQNFIKTSFYFNRNVLCVCVQEEWTLINSSSLLPLPPSFSFLLLFLSFILLSPSFLQVEAAEENFLLLSSPSWRLVTQRGKNKSDSHYSLHSNQTNTVIKPCRSQWLCGDVMLCQGPHAPSHLCRHSFSICIIDSVSLSRCAKQGGVLDFQGRRISFLVTTIPNCKAMC